MPFISGPEGGNLNDVYITRHWIEDKYIGWKLYIWGKNDTAGMFGVGDRINRSSPIQIGSLTNWKSIECGYSWTHMIKTDGTLWGCGTNYRGQLGDGTTSPKSSPIQIGSLTDWKQVSHGYIHTVSVKTDGTLWTWGWNDYRQLGDGTTTNKSSPVQIGSMNNWTTAIGLYDATLAIKTDGTIWGWGRADIVGVADNNTFEPSPIQIGSHNDWKFIAGGARSSYAIKKNGTLWSWGWDANGSLGQNFSGGTVYSPTQIGSSMQWKTIASGWFSVLAIKTDGTLWAWGKNNKGQLGLGDTIDRSVPTQVGNLTDWKQVACGYHSAFAVKVDGTLWAWGMNRDDPWDYGMLGLNDTIDRSSPIQVGSLTNWKYVSSNFGGWTTAALTYGD